MIFDEIPHFESGRMPQQHRPPAAGGAGGHRSQQRQQPSSQHKNSNARSSNQSNGLKNDRPSPPAKAAVNKPPMTRAK